MTITHDGREAAAAAAFLDGGPVPAINSVIDPKSEEFASNAGQMQHRVEELQRAMLFYGHTRQGPIYHPQADLCVMAADGRFVSGCEALIDARNGEADVERVCTHSDFRRRGFARAEPHGVGPIAAASDPRRQ